MNTVLMFVIMGLVCRFRYKAPGGGFRNLKFDLLCKYIYTHKACISRTSNYRPAWDFAKNYYT